MKQLKSSIGNRDHISLDDVCHLISIETVRDNLGQFIKTEKPVMIFCSLMSITRAEFNTAGQMGHKPDMMLIVDSDSYNQEKYLEYQNKKYAVYKTFRRVDHYTELYCEVKAGD